MTGWTAIAAGLLAAGAVAAPAAAQNAGERVAWNRPAEPFRIIGNVYYVGTEGLSAYLVTSPAGHVLIDGGLPESAPRIMANIAQLGFRVEDVRYLLINHSHFDHAGGLAALKRRSGAALLASVGDRPDLEAGRTIGRSGLDGFPPVAVDRVIRDGARLRIGGVTLTAHLTPGHTRGCTSWSVPVREGGRSFTVFFACSLTVAGEDLVGDRTYPRAAGDFRRTFARLGRMKADVFLNFHAEGFDLAGKRARQRAGDALAFVDPSELPRRVAAARAAFEAELARQTAAAARDQ